MATVASVALTQPASDPNINETQTFTQGGQITKATHGGLDYDMYLQWDQGTATWQDIPSSAAALTTPTNPIVSSAGDEVEYTGTVTGNTAGSYNVRIRTVDNNDGGAEDFSSSQAVTVNAAAHTATVAQTMPTPSQSATGAEEFAAVVAQTMPTPSQDATGETGTPYLEFDGYRWRNDDGDEAAATWIAAENVNLPSNELVLGQVYRIRVVLSNTGNATTPATPTYLRTSINSGAFVRYGSNGIEIYDSSNLTHGEEPTNQMSSGQGTFGGGEISDNNNFTPNEWIAADGYAEFEFVFKVNSPLVVGDTVDFKHNANGSNPGDDWDAYNVTIPQLTVVEIEATAAQTMPTPTQNATGAETFAAAVSQTAPTPSQSATGTHGNDMAGAVAQTMPTPSQSSTGAIQLNATAAHTAPTPSQSASGGETFTATVAQTAPTPTQAATGTHGQTHTATAAQTAPTPAQSATGAEKFQATAAQTAPTPSQSATAEHPFTATASQTSPTPSQAATGTHATADMAGSVAQTAPTPTQAATGAETFAATAGQISPTPSQSASGFINPDAAAAQTVPTPSQSASATHTAAGMTGTAGQTMPTPAQDATGEETISAAAAQTMPTPLQAATASEIFVASVAQRAPTPTQAAVAIILPDCVAAQIMPTPTQSSVALFVGGVHRAESIMDAVVAAVTGLTTTGSNVHRARAYPVQVSELPAILVWQGEDDAVTQLVTDAVVSQLAVHLDAVAREPAGGLETTLNLIREEVTAALMADYTLGLPYVEGIMESDAEEPAIIDEGDAPAASMRMNWGVTYHHGRGDPAN